MHATVGEMAGDPVPEFGYAVEVVEGLIDPDTWQTLDLSRMAVCERAFAGVAARFGGYEGLNVPSTVSPEAQIFAEMQTLADPQLQPADPVQSFADTWVADETGVEILSPRPAAVQRLQRVIRKLPVLQVAGLEPVMAVQQHGVPPQNLSSQILSRNAGHATVQAGYQHVARQAGRNHHLRLDKAGLNLAIGMMLFAWVAVLGVGTYMGMTPKSGAKIIWRD